jgi:hypothetical protein
LNAALKNKLKNKLRQKMEKKRPQNGGLFVSDLISFKPTGALSENNINRCAHMANAGEAVNSRPWRKIQNRSVRTHGNAGHFQLLPKK